METNAANPDQSLAIPHWTVGPSLARVPRYKFFATVHAHLQFCVSNVGSADRAVNGYNFF